MLSLMNNDHGPLIFTSYAFKVQLTFCYLYVWTIIPLVRMGAIKDQDLLLNFNGFQPKSKHYRSGLGLNPGSNK